MAFQARPHSRPNVQMRRQFIINGSSDEINRVIYSIAGVGVNIFAKQTILVPDFFQRERCSTQNRTRKEDILILVVGGVTNDERSNEQTRRILRHSRVNFFEREAIQTPGGILTPGTFARYLRVINLNGFTLLSSMITETGESVFTFPPEQTRRAYEILKRAVKIILENPVNADGALVNAGLISN